MAMRKEIKQYSSEFAGLAQHFYVNPEKCENPDHFDGYIRWSALGDYRMGLGTTHILIDYLDEKPLSICGFISFKAASLVDESDGVTGYPAMEIAELAVDKEHEGLGCGRALLNFALQTAVQLKEVIGIKYIIVCAEKNAVGFYKNVLKFSDATDSYKIPRETWNEDCVPLYLKLPEL